MKKICILFLVLCISWLLLPVNLQANSPDAFTIITNPGEDASSEMNINWHMDQGVSGEEIIYTLREDTEWQEAITVPGVCKASTVFDGMNSKDAAGNSVVENPNIQKCTANLTDLESDSEYMYKVGAASKSETHYFKTAGAEEFSFLWMSDWHAYLPLAGRLTSATAMINTALTVDPSVDFMFATGDTTAWGGSYSFWKDMYTKDQYKNYMWASINGNHDNMDSTNSKNTYEFFKTANNNPLNGYEGQEGVCYYFKYNNVLFITLNNEILGTSVSSAAVTKAQEWVAQVIESNPSQFIFVAEHYEWFNGITGASRDYGYNRWQAFFDKYGVDLAMGGNNHIYARSYPLYNGEVSNDSTKGTVYMQAPSSDNERGQAMDDTLTYNTDKIAYRFSEGGKTVGAILVTVNSQKVTTRLLDRNGNILDTTDIMAKRSAFPMENLNKDEFEHSFSFTRSSLIDNAGIINCSTEGVGYVYKIDYVDELGNILASNPLKKLNQINFGISNIEDVSEITAKIYYRDATVIDVPVKVTSQDIDKLSNLKINYTDGSFKLNWDYTGSDSQLKQWVFVDGVALGEVLATSKEYQLTDINPNSVVELRDASNSTSARLITRYNLYGDVNFDGTINIADVEKVQKHVTGIETLTEEALRLADINLDGEVTMADATYIHLFYANKLMNIVKKEFTVTFIDMNGSVIETKKVLAGNSVVAPEVEEIEGYKFIKWDKDLSYITDDLLVRQICETLPTKIILTGKQVSQIGKTVQLQVSISPIQTLQDVNWTVDNADLAEVENGLVTCKAPGTVTVTATSKVDSSLSDSIEIVINDAITLSAGAFVYSDTAATIVTINDLDYRISGPIYQTLQAAVDAITSGGKIFILPGRYDGDVIINKAVNIVTINDNIDPNKETRYPEATLTGKMAITASNVNIRGLAFNYTTSQSPATGLIYVTGGANVSNVDISYNDITSRGLASHTGIIRLGNSAADTTLENFTISYNKITSTSTNSIISNRNRDTGQASEDVRFKTTLKNVIISNNVTSGGIFGNLNLEMGTNGSVRVANNTFGTATDHIIRFNTGSGTLTISGHTSDQVTLKVTTITLVIE